MLYYKVIHVYVTYEKVNIRYKFIGIYDNKQLAKGAVELLKDKEGFSLRADNFYIYPVIRIRKPKFLNRTNWEEGFFTYIAK